MVVGVEVGEKGTPHLQGYVRFVKQHRFAAAKKQIGCRAHIEIAKGDEQQNDEYCRKDGVIALEMGKMNPAISAKGCKSQSGDILKELIKQRLSGVTPTQIANGEYVMQYFRYEKMIEKIVAATVQQNNMAELTATYVDVNWRKWQLQLIEQLQSKPNDRKIIWYVDEKGNSGKTFVTKYLLTLGNTIRLENGKSADIKYALNGQKIVVFDL